MTFNPVYPGHSSPSLPTGFLYPRSFLPVISLPELMPKEKILIFYRAPEFHCVPLLLSLNAHFPGRLSGEREAYQQCLQGRAIILKYCPHHVEIKTEASNVKRWAACTAYAGSGRK